MRTWGCEGDFGFWIADFGFQIQSKIRNPKSKMYSPLLLDLHHLRHPRRVSAVLEGGGEEDLDDAADVLFPEQLGAEAEDVTVVMFTGAAGGDLIVDQGGADAVNLVGGDGHADA